MTLDERALDYLLRHGEIEVRDLYEALQVGAPQLTEKDATDLVWRLAGEGKVELAQVRPSSVSLGGFLRMWELNLFFYISLLASLATICVVYLLPSSSPFVILRWVLGLLFVLFVPGYVAVEGLLGFVELDLFERVALSVGLSLTLAMFDGLLLNYTPWGITLTPIMISLTVLTVVLDVVALLRRYTHT
jgi:hypothetical protein